MSVFTAGRACVSCGEWRSAASSAWTHSWRQQPSRSRAPATSYPPTGPLAVAVERGGTPDTVIVVATASRAIYPEEAVTTFHDLVREKDRPENEVLPVTYGAPDTHGHTCGFDLSVLHMLQGAGQAGELLPEDPVYLKAVALHQWGTKTLIGIRFTEDYIAPWHT